MTSFRLPAFDALLRILGRSTPRAVLVAIVLGASSAGALARCKIDSNVNTFVFSLDMGTVVISPDLPVGSVIASKRFPRVSANTRVGSCTN